MYVYVCMYLYLYLYILTVGHPVPKVSPKSLGVDALAISFFFNFDFDFGGWFGRRCTDRDCHYYHYHHYHYICIYVCIYVRAPTYVPRMVWSYSPHIIVPAPPRPEQRRTAPSKFPSLDYYSLPDLGVFLPVLSTSTYVYT